MLLKIIPFAMYESPVTPGFAEHILPILRILCYNGSLVTELWFPSSPFTSPLCKDQIEKFVPSNSYFVAYVFVAGGTFLRSRCLAMDFYYSSTIPAFRRNVKISQLHTCAMFVNVKCYIPWFKSGTLDNPS
jgi:hypothetical protein